ncbi:MAG: hypothetical protein ABI422_05515 [Sphingomicrobium sp.]
MSAFDPLRTSGPRAIGNLVRVTAFLDGLSERAPTIVVLSLCAALVGAWSEAPVGLANGLAMIVCGLALVLLLTRGRRNQFKNAEELGSSRSRDWLTYELAGKGSPPGAYVLGFFCVLTIALTGFQSPYSRLAWAGLFLCVVWGIVNARYPADETSER